MIEYDEGLTQLLLENNFDRSNIMSFLDRFSLYLLQRVVSRGEIDNGVKDIQNYFKELLKEDCTIFMLPSGRRDGKCALYLVLVSKEKLRRLINLKAFI